MYSMDNFNLEAFHILYGNRYCIDTLLILASMSKVIMPLTETKISLNTKILNAPTFLGNIKITLETPSAVGVLLHVIIDNERLPQPMIENELGGIRLNENENSITINKLLAENPHVDLAINNEEAYLIHLIIELYLTKLQLRKG